MDYSCDLLPPISVSEFMSYEYNLAIAEVDRSLKRLRDLWDDAKYEAIRDEVLKSIDLALDKRLDMMAHRDGWLK